MPATRIVRLALLLGLVAAILLPAALPTPAGADEPSANPKAPADKDPDVKKESLAAFAWLAGSWEGKSEQGLFEEHWTTPVGGLMLGMGRQTHEGRTLFYEFIRITAEGDDIHYRVIVGGQPEVAFKLVSHKGDEAVFENPDHDFPQRIVYRKKGADALTARIEGKQDGQPAAEEFELKRKK